MSLEYGALTILVISALEELGPMTVKEIAFETGVSVATSSMVCTRCRTAKRERRIYIHSWVHVPITGLRMYPRMVFAAGDKPDAPRPVPLTNKQRTAKRRERKTHQMVNSIFAIGDRKIEGLLNREIEVDRTRRVHRKATGEIV